MKFYTHPTPEKNALRVFSGRERKEIPNGQNAIKKLAFSGFSPYSHNNCTPEFNRLSFTLLFFGFQQKAFALYFCIH